MSAASTKTDTLTARCTRTWAHLIWPSLFALALYCVPLPQDHILTIHESVLPQTARTMSYTSDWLIPRRDAIAPWLENPPLPQWINTGLCSAIHSCEHAWIYRLASALAGAIVVLLVTVMGARLFGREIGLISGFTMATSYELVRYATLAEDEVFLALTTAVAMTCFIFAEFPKTQSRRTEAPSRYNLRQSLIGVRPLPVIGFFAATGVTNLTKGLIFGPMMVLIPVTCFLLLCLDGTRIKRYFWLWGALLFLALGSWWPTVVALKIPGAIDLWVYDLFGRASGEYAAMTEPFWYYAGALLQVTAPWFLIIPFAALMTWRTALRDKGSPERFVWIWALSVPLVLSFLSGKHHHYLLHAVAPWAILSALGLKECWARLPTHAWAKKNAGVVLFSVLAGAYAIALSTHKSVHHEDGIFLKKIARTLPGGPFLVDLSIPDHLKAFQIMFYLPYAHTQALHNLSFLRGANITADTVYVITENSRRSVIAQFGEVQILAQSPKTGRQQSEGSLLALFRLKYKEDLVRVSTVDLTITPMQAMYRNPGPMLKPPG